MVNQLKELPTKVKATIEKMKETFEEIKVEAKTELEHVKQLTEGK